MRVFFGQGFDLGRDGGHDLAIFLLVAVELLQAIGRVLGFVVGDIAPRLRRRPLFADVTDIAFQGHQPYVGFGQGGFEFTEPRRAFGHRQSEAFGHQVVLGVLFAQASEFFQRETQAQLLHQARQLFETQRRRRLLGHRFDAAADLVQHFADALQIGLDAL